MRNLFSRYLEAIKHGLIFFGTYLLSIFGYLKMHWLGKTGKKQPILLIHGYLNSNLVWVYFGKQLKTKGFGPIFTINLGWPFASIESYAEKVALKVEKIKQETGASQVILIGHSMGGLVGAYYSLYLDQKASVSGVITLSSPFKGTPTAKIGIGKCSKEMRVESDFVHQLSDRVLAEKKIPFFHIAGNSDWIVFPPDTALPKTKEDHKFVSDHAGHASVLFSKEVIEKVSNWISIIQRK